MLGYKIRISFTLLMLLAVLTGCRSMKNYQGPNEPLFLGNHAESPPHFDGKIKAVTWNIKFSKEIEQAIAELNTVEELQGADILLLQEMDEAGVEAIARELKYNYVYFPASVHTHHDKNFGNAILAKWPMSAPAKVVLPHANPKNKQTRIASRAIVTVGETELLVYSVHTETFYLSGRKRAEQIGSLERDIGEEKATVIVGGDFNTFTPPGVAALERRLGQIGLTRVSKGSGPTFKYGLLTFTVDHMLAKGVTVSEAGAWSQTEASDHFPVWVNLLVDPAKAAQPGQPDYGPGVCQTRGLGLGAPHQSGGRRRS